MWPFRRAKEPDSVGDRLLTALRRLDDLESGQRLLKTEWLDTLDRLERIAGRLAKRVERDGKATGVLSGGLAASPESPPAPVSEAMRQVLARRAHREGGGPTGA